jgi:hypothetical protein
MFLLISVSSPIPLSHISLFGCLPPDWGLLLHFHFLCVSLGLLCFVSGGWWGVLELHTASHRNNNVSTCHSGAAWASSCLLGAG